jgi:hypothetical protein
MHLPLQLSESSSGYDLIYNAKKCKKMIQKLVGCMKMIQKLVQSICTYL